jgi:hypothetical protein
VIQTVREGCRRVVRVLVLASLGGLLLPVVAGVAAAGSSAPVLAVQRISGADAIGTSIAVSQAEFPVAGSARAVVLARSDFFSDALAGGPLRARGRAVAHHAGGLAQLDPRSPGDSGDRTGAPGRPHRLSPRWRPRAQPGHRHRPAGPGLRDRPRSRRRRVRHRGRHRAGAGQPHHRLRGDRARLPRRRVRRPGRHRDQRRDPAHQRDQPGARDRRLSGGPSG